MAHAATAKIAEIILQAITEQGKSSRSVADATHIPSSTLHRRLGGDSPFTTVELEKIAAHLGTTMTALISRAEMDAVA